MAAAWDDGKLPVCGDARVVRLVTGDAVVRVWMRTMSDPDGEGSSRGNGGNAAGLGTELRNRVMSDARELADAFDAVFADARPENLDRLSNAADRLMRSAGRVMIETQRIRRSQP